MNKFKAVYVTIAALIGMCFSVVAAAAPVQVAWLDLMPQSDLDAMEQMPEISHDQPFDQANLPAVMFSSEVVDTYENTEIEIAGYMVPLEVNDEGNVTEFFFAPYMGACIHVPPPPPNQMIYVKYPDGMEIEGIWMPFIVQGKLQLETFDNGLGAASYSMTADNIRMYED